LDLNDANGHVGFSSFGLHQLNSSGQIDALLRELPAVRATAAEIITLSCYQTEYGIFNHERPHPERPLALVAMHPKEDVVEGGPLYSHIRRYYNYQIYKHFGLSLSEFLELPMHLADLLYDISRADATQHETTQRSVQRQLDLDFNEPS
jgi:hypothetical protein